MMTNKLSTNNIENYFNFYFRKNQFNKGYSFLYQHTIDTLDYSGTGLNSGSKVVLAAYGEKIRELATTVPDCLNNLDGFENAKLVMPGVVALQTKKFSDYDNCC